VKKKGGNTRNLQVDTYSPIRRAFRGVHVQIPETDFTHTVQDGPGLLVARDAYLVALGPSAVGHIERVDEALVGVVERGGRVGRLGGCCLEIVKEGVEVFVLGL
jgi:hypothetical protein